MIVIALSCHFLLRCRAGPEFLWSEKSRDWRGDCVVQLGKWTPPFFPIHGCDNVLCRERCDWFKDLQTLEMVMSPKKISFDSRVILSLFGGKSKTQKDSEEEIVDAWSLNFHVWKLVGIKPFPLLGIKMIKEESGWIDNKLITTFTKQIVSIGIVLFLSRIFPFRSLDRTLSSRVNSEVEEVARRYHPPWCWSEFHEKKTFCCNTHVNQLGHVCFWGQLESLAS